MVDAVETMAYAGEKPWHKLGHDVSGKKMSVKQMIKAGGVDWTVSLRPIQIGGSGKDPLDTSKWMDTSSFRALVRDSDNRLLDVVGSRFLPTQNEEAFAFFNEYVEAGDATMETIGSLRNGRMVWALANLNAGFTLAGGDNVKGYLLVALPHEQGKSIRTKFTSVRVVCWNTLSMALAGDGGYRQSHRMVFDKSAQEEAKRVLGIARESLDVHKEAATVLSRATISSTDARMFLTKMVDPKLWLEGVEVVAEKVEENDTRRKLRLCIDALDNSPGANLKSSKGTLWGVVNAVTYAVDHQFGRGVDQRLNRAWFGTGDVLKRRVFDEALKMATSDKETTRLTGSSRKR